jgi:hypothetical protein
MTLASLHLHFIFDSRIREFDYCFLSTLNTPSIGRPWFSCSKSHTLLIKKQVLWFFFSFIFISSVKITQTKIIILSVTDKHNFLNIFGSNFIFKKFCHRKCIYKIFQKLLSDIFFFHKVMHIYFNEVLKYIE